MQRFYFLPLVTTDIWPVSDGFLEKALALARADRARLIVTAIDIALPTISDSWSALMPDTPRLLRQANAKSRERCNMLSAKVAEAAGKGTDVRFETITSPFASWHDAVAMRARLFDLTVLELRTGDANGKAAAESIIFESGRPVMIVPPDWACTPFDHVVIAWDDSRAAARAVADASHFLAAARKITLLSISPCGTDEQPIGAGLANVLRARVTEVETIGSNASPQGVGNVLQEQALALSADLLVMGAFGHSRLRSFVLGSATDAVLSDPKLPVLMSY